MLVPNITRALVNIDPKMKYKNKESV